MLRSSKILSLLAAAAMLFCSSCGSSGSSSSEVKEPTAYSEQFKDKIVDFPPDQYDRAKSGVTYSKSADVTAFISVVQKYERITELTPEIMHELIEKIVVHAPDKSSGHRTQQIEIHYRFNVAVTTAVADSMKYDKKRKVA